MKQTPVEFLEKELNQLLVLFSTKWEQVNKAIEQAKEMEKEQLKEMYLKGIENYDPTFKNKEEPIQEILENLENQLKKVIKENPIDVNEDTYWRGVKIGLETSIEVIKFKVL